MCWKEPSMFIDCRLAREIDQVAARLTATPARATTTIASHLASVSPWAWSCSLGRCSCSAVVTAALAAPRLAPLARCDRGDHERRGRICPPPAEERVRAEADQERHG